MIENKKDWAIIDLTNKRQQFLEQVNEDSLKNILQLTKLKLNGGISHELARTIFLERSRIFENPWKVDPKDEKKFWNKTHSNLLKATDIHAEQNDKSQLEQDLLNGIIGRYTNEIAGKFNINTYNFSTTMVPFLFSRLLNTAISGWFRGPWSKKQKLDSALRISGDLDHIRTLANKGTVVLVPTHFSNLDSILVGYALYLIGLPPFLYGAGLNLYNNSIIAYFINRLGAYKVDRRKKNNVYLETLKSYSRIALNNGCHSLFFPGGTRSRSGGIEDKLKLGLLGTAVDAQYYNFAREDQRKNEKIFVLPLVISYHFVLEAASLINEHLKRTGKERYFIKNDQFSNWYKILNFMWQFFSKGGGIELSFGRPMDIFGHYVDENGVSFDTSGKEIDIRKYFYSHGKLKPIKQREEEYTALLGERILEEYKKENIVLSSHVVAFTAFVLLKQKFQDLDLYELLRIQTEDRHIPFEVFRSSVHAVVKKLEQLNQNEQVKLSKPFGLSLDEFIEHGLKNLGLYHSKKVLLRTKSGDISSADMSLLLFYHNRLLGYKLHREIQFNGK